MGINSCLHIAYSGSLDGYRKKNNENKLLRFLKDWFWTYKHNTVDASTRSAYFLIQAVKLLKEKHGVSSDQLQINLWGNIDSLNSKHMKAFDVLDFFKIEGYLPKSMSINRLMEADLLFLPLEKSNITKQKTLFIPGKLFEYLNVGKPIFALCENSDCRDILENSGLGICIEPDNVLLIADKLLEIIKNKDVLKLYKANDAYISNFSFQNKTKELALVFDSLNVNSI